MHFHRSGGVSSSNSSISSRSTNSSLVGREFLLRHSGARFCVSLLPPFALQLCSGKKCRTTCTYRWKSSHSGSSTMPARAKFVSLVLIKLHHLALCGKGVCVSEDQQCVLRLGKEEEPRALVSLSVADVHVAVHGAFFRQAGEEALVSQIRHWVQRPRLSCVCMS